MDGWGDADARTWLAMDLLAPVHELWAALEAAPAAQVTADGLLGEHRPELTEAALAGLVDLEGALVVGAALDVAAGLVQPEVLVLVECALVDEASRLSLLPLVNAAADLLVELERDAGQNEAGQNEAGQNEAGQNEAGQNEAGQDEAGQDDAGAHEAAQCDPDGSLGIVGSGSPGFVRDPAVAPPAPVEPIPAEAAAGARSDQRVESRVVVRGAPGHGAHRCDRGGCRGPGQGPVVAARAVRGGRRSRAPPPGWAVICRWVPGPR